MVTYTFTTAKAIIIFLIFYYYLCMYCIINNNILDNIVSKEHRTVHRGAILLRMADATDLTLLSFIYLFFSIIFETSTHLVKKSWLNHCLCTRVHLISKTNENFYALEYTRH